jgi:hypothetical protein
MQYWEVVTRSFRIAWDHKYLWLIALFSGESGGGFNYSTSQSSGNNANIPNLATLQQNVTTWLTDHIALVAALVVLWLVLVVVFFILGAVCEGATVRASAEHDAERPFGLRMAWRAGVARMWVMIRFRLLIVALGLPLTLLVIGLVVAVFVSVANNTAVAAPWLILFGFLLVVGGIPYTIYLFFLDRFGARAVMLELLAARAAIVRGHRLLIKRLGRSLLVGLVAIAVAIVLGIALACLSLIVVLPFIAAGAFAFSTGSGAAWPLIALAVIILLPLYLIVAGFLAAQSSTYWTLAFRRLDLEQAPAYYYQYQQPPQPPQQPPASPLPS